MMCCNKDEGFIFNLFVFLCSPFPYWTSCITVNNRRTNISEGLGIYFCCLLIATVLKSSNMLSTYSQAYDLYVTTWLHLGFSMPSRKRLLIVTSISELLGLLGWISMNDFIRAMLHKSSKSNNNYMLCLRGLFMLILDTLD